MDESNNTDRCRERISALVDGQLRGQEFADAAEAAVHDPDVRAAWYEYHLVGDVLRSGATAVDGALDTKFASRFAARLACEAAVNRPAVVAIEKAAVKPDFVNPGFRKVSENKSDQAANSPVFRWKLVAGLASVIALGAVSWNLLGNVQVPPGVPQLALVSKPAPTGGPLDRALVRADAPASTGSTARSNAMPQQMVRDARLDELLAAHEQLGGVSALQMPAGFLRNATFEGRNH